MSTKDLKNIPLQLLSFRLGQEVYAVDVMKIHGVERMCKITALPNMPEFLEGVIDLRDQIVPIVDLRKRFRLPAAAHDATTRIILAESAGRLSGFIVDAVFEVFQVEKESLGAIPTLGATASVEARFLHAVVRMKGNLIIIIDIDRVFTEKEKESLSLAASGK